jgi:glycosyltransferase involved in cell wall biosynthesis
LSGATRQPRDRARSNAHGIWTPRSGVRLSVVIPTMNEAESIGWVLERLPNEAGEVILVDGRSKDRTVEVAREVRPDIRVVLERRPGKGAAIRAGFAAARGDFIVMIDADGSMDPAEILRCLASLRDRRNPESSGSYDLVKGSRFLRGGGTADMSPIRAFGNDVLRRMVNVLYGVDWSDFCYGLIGMRRDCAAALGLRRDGFEIEAEILLRAVAAGMRVGEVASLEAPRLYGESNLNAWRDGRRVLKTILAERFIGDHVPAGLPAPVSALA